ncbi:MAG: MFS transporter [Gammaproteobacteria bacterium]|nr:MFS transporter [Gammaproteobacteria bacterium]
MSDQTNTPHRAWYFLLCYLACSAYTLDFVLRSALQPQLMAIYNLSASELVYYYNLVYAGLLVGVIGFGCLVDMINYRTCFIWIWLAQILGLVKVFAISPVVQSAPMAHQLKVGMFLMGISEGGIYAVIHPLLALAFNKPNESKAKIMNYLHTNWPLIAIFGISLQQIIVANHFNWYWQVYALLIFPSLYLLTAMMLPFPKQSYTHRIPLMSRIKSILRPGYLLLFFCMVVTVSIEHSPLSWVRRLIDTDNRINLFYFIIFAHCFQATARILVGTMFRYISPPGLLCFAAIACVISLFMISFTHHHNMVLIASAIFVFCIVWFWPTFIGIVADRYPLSGGIGMAVMNSGGFLAQIYIIPVLSKLPQQENLKDAFLTLAWYGVLIFILLATVHTFFRSQGGYKVFASADRSL